MVVLKILRSNLAAGNCVYSWSDIQLVGMWLHYNFEQIVNTLVPISTCHQAVDFSISQWVVTIHSWKVNCKSGITMALMPTCDHEASKRKEV